MPSSINHAATVEQTGGRVIKIFFMILLLQSILAATCAGATSQSPIITVTDFGGRTIRLNAPASRVVCLIESALSGIYMLNAPQAVCAVSTNIYQESVYRYYAAMDPRIAQKQLPTPGNWDFVSIEKVVTAKPDLVIIWANQTEAVKALTEKGIPVYGVQLTSIKDIFKEVKDLGILLGKKERARELINYALSQTKKISAVYAGNDKNQRSGVYFMWAQGELETSGAPSTVNAMIELAGGRNVCSHIKQEHTVISLETIITLNPDVIIMWSTFAKSPQEIMQMPVWQSLSAAKRQNVFELPSVFFCDLWTLKYLHAVKLMGAWFQGKKLTSDDLRLEKRAMLKALYGETLGGRIPLEE
ncbi:MAG: ABC transporter substrate-binding protein [Desulfobacteraceae bacterium]|jgi:iron complex transport system substrate-binding protein